MPLTARQEEMIRNAKPMDDLTIRLMLRENPELAELLCRIILARENLHVVKLRTQYDASRGGIARGITLDALTRDDAGSVENFEIQIGASGLDPKCGRYHSSVMDVEHLDPGEDFSELPESFVIFICDDDPYGKGEPVYVAKRNVYTTDRVNYTKARDYVQDFGDRVQWARIIGRLRTKQWTLRANYRTGNTGPETRWRARSWSNNRFRHQIVSVFKSIRNT